MIDMRKFKMSACVKLHSKMKGCVYLYMYVYEKVSSFFFLQRDYGKKKWKRKNAYRYL